MAPKREKKWAALGGYSREDNPALALPPPRFIVSLPEGDMHVAGRCAICDAPIYTFDGETRRNCCDEPECIETFARRFPKAKGFRASGRGRPSNFD